MAIDSTPRYAPSHVIIPRVMRLLPVERYIAHPAGSHRGPIRGDMTALECITAQGSRWFGCNRAYINAELRMVVEGTDTRDEVRMAWPTVPAEHR